MIKTHPLAAPGPARIDLFTRGRQATIIRDSFMLMKQAARQIPLGQSILYINTLTSADPVIEVAEKLSKRYDRAVCTFSANSREMMDRLDFLAVTIKEKNIKLVILNAFEFAAMFSRQRNRLAIWLREMRDAFGIRIVVYSILPPQTIGAHGVLATLSERVQDTGAWQYETDDSLTEHDSPLEAAKEFANLLDTDADDSSEQTYWVDRPKLVGMFDFAKKMSSLPLKNNDLAGVVTREEVDEEVGELEYA